MKTKEEFTEIMSQFIDSSVSCCTDKDLIIDQAWELNNSYETHHDLLCAFFKFFRDNGEANIGMTIEQFVDAFLNAKKT